jgi:hypothetical protein
MDNHFMTGHHDERKTDAARHPDRHRPALPVASRIRAGIDRRAARRLQGDYEKYCKSVVPGGGQIIACLAKESDKLAPACKKVLEAAEKK